MRRLNHLLFRVIILLVKHPCGDSARTIFINIADLSLRGRHHAPGPVDGNLAGDWQEVGHVILRYGTDWLKAEHRCQSVPKIPEVPSRGPSVT